MNQRPPQDNGAWRAVSWSWSPLEWSWLPSAGGYRRPLGAPSRTVSIRVDTRHVAPTERFELWRDITGYGHEYGLPDQAVGKRFAATGLGFFTEGKRLTLYESDPVVALRTRQQSREAGDDLNIGFLIDGERLGETDGDDRSRTTAGEFFIDDAGRRLEATYPTRHKAAWLGAPRAEVSAIFRGDIPPPGALLAILKSSRLAPVLHAQFAAVARHGLFFTDAEGDAAMTAMTSLVLAAFAAGRDEAALGHDAAPAIVIAAKRHIDTHLGDPRLDVEDVAQAVGCSRTSLYRAFAEAGTGVAETIRDLRLERLRALLESEPVTITEASERCGFADPRTMQRQVKARFGLSARDLQARARRL
jgi:AraC family transcriptional activator of tynA and feaB